MLTVTVGENDGAYVEVPSVNVMGDPVCTYTGIPDMPVTIDILDGGHAPYDETMLGRKVPAPEPPVMYPESGAAIGTLTFCAAQVPEALRGSVGSQPLARPS